LSLPKLCPEEVKEELWALEKYNKMKKSDAK